MGGIGSGSYYRIHAKDMVGKRLNIHELKKKGFLKPGTNITTSWSRNGQKYASIGGTVTEKGLMMNYTVNGEAVCYEVPFTWTECNYGGERPWFQCPKCYARIAVIYLKDKYFLCRKCQDLSYESQRVSDSDRMALKANRIRERLGGDAGMLNLFPDKPKGMHWKTYYELKRKAERAEMITWGKWAEDLGVLGRRIGNR